MFIRDTGQMHWVIVSAIIRIRLDCSSEIHAVTVECIFENSEKYRRARIVYFTRTKVVRINRNSRDTSDTHVCTI